jgi:hypothetical protein
VSPFEGIGCGDGHDSPYQICTGLFATEPFSAGVAADIESRSLPVAGDIHAGQRLTPLEAVLRSAAKKMDAHEASVQTGIPPQTAIQRDEIAVLLFRDFQVRRLAGGN